MELIRRSVNWDFQPAAKAMGGLKRIPWRISDVKLMVNLVVISLICFHGAGSCASGSAEGVLN